jgi:hypothetical protein
MTAAAIATMATVEAATTTRPFYLVVPGRTAPDYGQGLTTSPSSPSEDYCESAFWKKAATAPAAPATTMTAHSSSATSSARPAGVIGFFN